jgi:hypothetical protein
MDRVLWRGLIEGKEKKKEVLEWRGSLGFYLPCPSLP